MRANVSYLQSPLYHSPWTFLCRFILFTMYPIPFLPLQYSFEHTVYKGWKWMFYIQLQNKNLTKNNKVKYIINRINCNHFDTNDRCYYKIYWKSFEMKFNTARRLSGGNPISNIFRREGGKWFGICFPRTKLWNKDLYTPKTCILTEFTIKIYHSYYYMRHITNIHQNVFINMQDVIFYFLSIKVLEARLYECFC